MAKTERKIKEEMSGKEDPQSSLAICLMITVPIVFALARRSEFVLAEFLNEQFSLYTLPKHLHEHAEYIVFITIGALIVSISKFVFGIRVWGVFRPILIAVAFKVIGILEGMIFLAFILSVNAFLIRPMLKSRKTPYFARVSILLSSSVLLMLVPIFIGKWTNSASLLQVAMFPIIALCLITESFAVKTRKEGLLIAIKRTFSTILVATMIALSAKIPGIIQLFLCCPELLFAQIGLILLVAHHLNFRLVEKIKPKLAEIFYSNKTVEISSGEVIKV